MFALQQLIHFHASYYSFKCSICFRTGGHTSSAECPVASQVQCHFHSAYITKSTPDGRWLLCE